MPSRSPTVQLPSSTSWQRWRSPLMCPSLANRPRSAGLAVIRRRAPALAIFGAGMASASGQRRVTRRDGARVALRPIAPEDKPLLAASFARLSEQSRYRRFFTAKPELSEGELDYLV